MAGVGARPASRVARDDPQARVAYVPSSRGMVRGRPVGSRAGWALLGSRCLARAVPWDSTRRQS